MDQVQNVTPWKVVRLCLAVWLLWVVIPEREITHPPGILVANEPLKIPLSAPRPFAYKNYTIDPLQGYELSARVLAKKSYLFFQNGADLAPMDMVFGWGIMSNSAIVDRMHISIMNRFYRAKADSQDSLDWDNMAPYLDNNHLIPSSSSIRHALDHARIGEIIHLKGYLVEATRADGYHWISALGTGSVGDTVLTCKLIYVTDFEEMQ